MRRDTIFDLASVTKTFTTIAVMQQVEAGRVDLDEPVATYLPAFAENGKDDVTIRHLLTHTGGLPAWLPLYSAYPTVEERLAAVLAVKPDRRARRGLRLLRPRPDHPGPGGGGGHRPTAGRGDRPTASPARCG